MALTQDHNATKGSTPSKMSTVKSVAAGSVGTIPGNKAYPLPKK